MLHKIESFHSRNQISYGTCFKFGLVFLVAIPASARMSYPINMPAMVAEIKDAMLPPISAFIPNFDKVLRCHGANEPIPPI